MPKPANNKNFYDNWKEQIDAYWKNHNLDSEDRKNNKNKLIIKHTPEPTPNDLKPKPQILFTIIKENGEYYYQEGEVDEDKQLITRETLEYSAKKNNEYENKHEAVGLLFKFFYQDNQKHRSRFWPRMVTLLLSGSIGGLLGLIVGLLGTAAIIAGSVAIPLTAVSFAISAPIFVPILVAVAVGLLATFATYKGLTALYRPDIMPHPFDNNLKPPKTHYRKSLWRYLLLSPLSMINNAAKWLARSIIVDTVLFKYTVGLIIAFIANKGNKYYQVPAQNLTGILSNLIFVGGTEPINIVKKDNELTDKDDILLGPILSEQYRQFIEFKKEKEAKFARYHVRVNNETFLTCYRANNYDAIKQYNQANTNKTPIDVPDTASDDIKSENAKKEVVIYFCGNSSGGPQLADEALKRLKKRAKVLHDQHGDSLEPTVLETIIFSYPGVLNSTGQVTKADHLLQSTIAVVNNLLDEGYNINNIHLDGMSLGGANEIHLAYYFEQRGAQFKTVIASRTFSSTLATGMHYVSTLPIVGQPLCYALLPFIAFGLWAVNWQMFSDFKYWSLNSDKKWFFTAQSPGKVNQYFQANPTEGTSSQDLVLPTKSGGLYFGPIMRLERFCKKLYFVLSGNAWEYKKINNAHKLLPVQRKESNEDEISVEDKATLHYVPGMEVHSEMPHGGKNENKIYLAVRGTKKSLPIGKISQVSYNSIDTKGEEYPILCSQRDAIEYMTRGGIGLFKNRVKQTASSISTQQSVLGSQPHQ